MKEMKKYLSAAIITAILTSMTPVYPQSVAADITYSDTEYVNCINGDCEAEINGVKYETFESAIEAAQSGSTITLLKNIDVKSQIVINKNITIVADDAAEQIVIKRTSSIKEAVFCIENGASLTFGGSGSEIIIDGGAVWGDNGNEGVDSTWPIIMLKSGKFYLMENAVIQNNDNTAGDGGAIVANGGGNAFLHIYGTIRNNSAKLDGGGISANCYTNIYETAQIINNLSGNNGGGINNYSGGVVTIDGGTFTGNEAKNGGVVWCDGKTLINGGEFKVNTAVNGSALYINSSSSGRAATISGGSFSENTSTNNEDIYINTNYVYLRGSIQAEKIYIADGKSAYINGALSGYFNISSGADIHGNPVVLTGSGYTITEQDIASIGVKPEYLKKVLDSNRLYLKYPPIAITKQPKNLEVFIGDVAKITFTAGGDEVSENLKYTWYSCEDATGSDPVKVSETQIPEYNANTENAGNKYYFCEVSGSNLETTRTDIIRIKVMDPLVAEAPEFVEEPQDVNYTYGDEVTLNVNAKTFDNGVLSYKWYRSDDDIPTPETDVLIPGAESASYTFTPDTSDNQYYYCVAVNTIGQNIAMTVSRMAKVSCAAKVMIIGAPQTGSVINAEYKNINVSDLSFNWQISDSLDENFTNINGASSPEFTVGAEHEGKYIRINICSGNAVFVSKPKLIKPSGTYNEYSGDYIYLSDVPKSQLLQEDVGHLTLKFDTNTSGETIRLLENNKVKYFTKGLGAHAAATLVYDVEEITDNYCFTKFTSYLGLDSSQGANGNGVKFIISVSDNLDDWTEIKRTGTLKGNTNAEYVELDLTGVKYLKIYIDSLGSNSYDHSVLGGAKLSKADYVENKEDYDWIKTVDNYDAEISEYEQINSELSYAELIEREEYKMLVYKRHIVEKVGYDYLQAFAHTDESSQQALNWFFNDNEAITMYVNGGSPTGSYQNSIKVLARLYNERKVDLSDAEFGSLYKRMIITLSLTHSSKVLFWADSKIESDPLRRYDIYKKLHDNDLLINSVFEKLNVEEMRWVLGDLMDDDEIEWLNYYARKTSTTPEKDYNSSNFSMGPYFYIKYTMGFNYYQDKYYNEENKKMWQSKYFLTQEYAMDDRFEINIPYQYNYPKLWTVFAEGAVCGGISKTGTNLQTVFGVPGVVIGQPGHAAYLRYIYKDNNNENSRATWTIWNDVSGWTLSEKGERLLCGWGSKSWDSFYQVSYVLLAQEALDDEENYNKALALVRTADTKTDMNQKISLYEQALKIQPINLDAWEGLIYAYNNSGRTEDDYIDIAKRISEIYTYYPLPMWDVLENLIKPHLSSSIKLAELSIYQQTALNKASLATEETTLQPQPCKVMANYLLGNKSFELATFSFDGNKANKIVLAEEFAEGGNELLYSISGDNEEAWINAGNVTEVELTSEQIENITAENDILVRLQGTTNYYTIDITQASPPSGIYANDNENELIKATESMEWSIDGTNWNKYDKSQRFAGETTVYLRNSARGTMKMSAASVYKFNTDISTDERKYISIHELSVYGYSSSQGGGEAYKAIDGDINTIWHTVWSGTDTERFISIKIGEPKYLSAFEYTPRTSGTNGIFTLCEIYTSVDGYTWHLIDTASWQLNNSKKIYNFSSPVYAQYIKLAGKQAGGNFGSAAMIELYEDTTVSQKEIQSISVKSLPNKTEYLMGEEINISGLVIEALFDDGTKTNLPYSMLSFSKTIFDTIGDEVISVTIPSNPDVKAVTFSVSVAENTKTVTCLSVVSLPEKTVYAIGESLNSTGLAVKAVYDDETTGYVPLTSIKFTPEIFAEPGEQEVTLTYKGATAAFTVTVEPGIVSGYLRYEPVPDSCLVYVIGCVSGAIPQNGYIVIPSTVMINGCEYEVIGISEEAFINQKTIISVTVPNTVTSIADRAFYGCDNLKSLNFTAYNNFDTLSIGNNVFDTNTEGIVIGGNIIVSSNELVSLFPNISSGSFDIVSTENTNSLFSVLSFDSGYYMNNGEKKGAVRLFAKPASDNFTKCGFVYVNPQTGETGSEFALDNAEIVLKNGFYIDLFDIPENFGTVNAKAFIVIDGKSEFSDIISATVNFDRLISFK